MLVWLSSYPRSGNTLTRAILNQCFDIKTRAIDNSGDDRVFASTEVREVIGHYSGGPDGDDLVSFAKNDTNIHMLKTHLAPLTKDRTIHIVRDGRAAIVSYYHYLRDIEKVDVSLETVLRGEVYAGSWSSHYHLIKNQSNRLLLRYEDLVRNPIEATSKISKFIGIDPKKPFTLTFEEMQRAHPQFFRAGQNDVNIAELSDHTELYNNLHGATAAELGYF
jgi:hypothetical protein